MPALDLLDRSRRGERVDLGREVVVVGGGDTAMDAVRTAQRFTGRPVTLLYRRTRAGDAGGAPRNSTARSKKATVLEELVSPVEILRDDGRVVGVRCVRNTLGDAGPDGRRSPVPIAGSEFVVPAIRSSSRSASCRSSRSSTAAA